MRFGEPGAAVKDTRSFKAKVGASEVSLLHNGEQALPAMMQAIEHGKHEILVEMYWFGSDKTGSRFATALMKKAREGVRVQVVYDAIGSFDSDGAMFVRMREAGCEVLDYNPIAPWRARFRIGVVNNRDHRKLLVVDRNIGFTGGVNFADPWAPAQEGGGGWRDDMVRIQGASVEQMRDIFKHTWQQLLEPEPSVPSLPPPVAEMPLDAKAGVVVLANQYFRERRAIRQAYLERIRGAQRCVYIANAYFVPALSIRRALVEAAKRGVDVRVIVPGKSDVPAVYYAARYLYQRLMDAGIQLHEWRGNMLHAKTASVDGRWCTVGTYNLDYRSLRFNLEVTAAIESEAVASAMQRRFEEDLQNAPQVDATTWRFRSIFERLLEGFFYLFRKLL